MMNHFYTVGYSGFQSLEQFACLMESLGVEVVADIRWAARSRKLGFAKAALQYGLQMKKIRYQHFPDLGSPPNVRHEFQKSKNRSPFCKGVLDSVNQIGSGSIGQLSETMNQKTVCLLCACEYYLDCHRWIVSAMIEANGFIAVHLPPGRTMGKLPESRISHVLPDR